MNRPVRTGKDFDEARARILEAAEKQFRRVGYHRTSVADIAAELGMSPANIYRFFPVTSLGRAPGGGLIVMPDFFMRSHLGSILLQQHETMFPPSILGGSL